MNEKIEIWKPVKGYEKFYMVSNFGEILNIKTRRKLKARIGKRGYVRVNLCANNIQKTKRVHVLVAEAFLENRNNKKQVNHKDFNKQNNNVNNLEWISSKENVAHYCKSEIGCHKKKKVLMLNNKMEEVRRFDSIKEAGDYIGIPSQCISRALRTHYKAGGYNWAFLNKEDFFKKIKVEVYQFDIEGRFIKKYESIASAAREIMMSEAIILDSLNFRTATVNGKFFYLRKKDINVKEIERRKERAKKTTK